MKWKRKQRKRLLVFSRKKVILLTAILIALLSCLLIFKLNIFVIKSIDVFTVKIDCTNEDKLSNSSQLLGKNIFFINKDQIQSKLKKDFYCIKNIDISKKFPSKIRLSVFGREPAIIVAVLKDKEATQSALFEELRIFTATASAEASPSAEISFAFAGETDQFIVDKEGVVYSTNIEQINAPILMLDNFNVSLGQKLNEQIITNTLKILEKLNTFNLEVKELKIYSQETLLIKGLPKIVFRLDERVEEQIASLQLILEQAKMETKVVEFIDLRFDKPIVRFASKKK